jgi:hypothetical protein
MLPGSRPTAHGAPRCGRLEEEVRTRIPQARPRYPPLGAAVVSRYVRAASRNAREVGRVRAASQQKAFIFRRQRHGSLALECRRPARITSG